MRWPRRSSWPSSAPGSPTSRPPPNGCFSGSAARFPSGPWFRDQALAHLPRPAGQRIAGLFVGGTLCKEASIIAGPEAGTFIDFGDDQYTQGRAHPMIDPTLRLEELARVAADPEVGVVLLDVVLGHGAEADPAALLAPALESVPQPVVLTVVGTAADPQDLARQVQALTAAGAEVHLSNALATRRAVELLGSR